jgi:hypothetical protein
VGRCSASVSDDIKQSTPLESGEGGSAKCETQLSRLKLVPNVDGDPIYTETASSLPPVQSSLPPALVLVKDSRKLLFTGTPQTGSRGCFSWIT